jgi:hypothetical protein
LLLEEKNMASESRDIASPNAAEIARPPRPAVTKPARTASLAGARLNLAGEDRLQLIAEAAYFRAERRGFQPGKELEDWLAAEIEIDALLNAEEDVRAR